MDYLKCEVGKKELGWFGDPILSIEIHFSPEMIAVIDNDFLYEEVLLTLEHSTRLVRHWLLNPGVQTIPTVAQLQYSKGTTVEKLLQWKDDYERAKEQLQVFRWRLIKISRGIPDKRALTHSVTQPMQEILEPVRVYNGNFGAQGY